MTKISLNLPLVFLTILFVALKVHGTITWSWLWVLSPLWIPLSIGLLAMLFAFAVMLFVAVTMALAFVTGNVTIERKTK